MTSLPFIPILAGVIYSDSGWAHLGKTDTDANIYVRQSNSNAYIGVAH